MVSEGEIAVVHFTGRVAEGEDAGAVFDTTQEDVAREAGVYHDHRDYEPVAFRVGERRTVPGLDEAVREMAVGEERTVELEPARAFGERDEGQVVELPRRDLEARDGATPAPGRLVETEDGATGWVTRVDGEAVAVDFNHELAGLAVEFDVTLVDVRGGD
ncbi:MULTISPECIES: peptidylprolyl isomerase [Halorussus]|uniref:FKBP-type peptidyl-prolyl cis-trans isomerase n=1 Tax=Halorussus TaxID=1070314 RepID=UPI000E216A1E|nr:MULTISPECIES: FKBP-type peptidyl-prolyl cis-trans isomerase [Halorussus]NHN58851.1 peptidylprolyl isomerase [Halorussus sp. JP-T4]